MHSALRRLGGRALRDYLPPIVLILALVAAWQSATGGWDIEAYLLPSPLRIASAGFEARHLLSEHIQQTLRETLLGFAAALCGGLLLAGAIDLSSFLRR